MRIIIVRHGESEMNVKTDNGEKLYCGALDIPLSERGVSDAKKLIDNDYLKDVDKVYSSDLIRAYDTAKYATGREDIIKDKRIRERSLGDFEGRSEDTMRKIYPEVYEKAPNGRFRCDFVLKTPTGENYTDVSKRIRSFFEDVVTGNNTKIAVFAHMHAIRCMLYVLLGLEKEVVSTLKIPYSTPIVLEGDTIGEFKLVNFELKDLIKVV